MNHCAGFMEIDQDDQIRLIKQGSFEVMLARFSLLVDESQQTLLDPSMTLRAHRWVLALWNLFCV